jgi:hypothetical protein
MRHAVTEQLAFMDGATNTHHCRGTKIIPFSMHNLDEVLGDVGVNISAGKRASHWLNPVNPHAYRRVTAKVIAGLDPVDTEKPSFLRLQIAPPPSGPNVGRVGKVESTAKEDLAG